MQIQSDVGMGMVKRLYTFDSCKKDKAKTFARRVSRLGYITCVSYMEMSHKWAVQIWESGAYPPRELSPEEIYSKITWGIAR